MAGTPEAVSGTFEEQGALHWIKMFLSAFVVNIPGMPTILRIFFLLPFYSLAIYFFYLSLPTVFGSGTPPP
jgi:hypothetical protein